MVGRIDERDVPDVVFSSFAGNGYAANSVVRFFNDKTTTVIYTLPLHSALPNLKMHVVQPHSPLLM